MATIDEMFGVICMLLLFGLPLWLCVAVIAWEAFKDFAPARLVNLVLYKRWTACTHPSWMPYETVNQCVECGCRTSCQHRSVRLTQCHAASALAYGGCGAMTRECKDCGHVLQHDISIGMPGGD